MSHYCKGYLPNDFYGPALYECREAEGRLWVRNAEYGSQVNFCPYCGYKAPIQLHAVPSDFPPRWPDEQETKWVE